MQGHERRRLVGRSGFTWEVNKINCKGTGWDGVDRIKFVLNRDKRAGSCEHCKLKLISLKYGKFLD
jgi:hypothetical protein